MSTITINQQPVQLEALRQQGESVSFVIAGVAYHFTRVVLPDGSIVLRDAHHRQHPISVSRTESQDAIQVSTAKAIVHAALRQKHKSASDASQDGTVRAPMTGTVVAVWGDLGVSVEKGQKLLVLEAMKLQVTLTAPVTGIVKQWQLCQGALVQQGTVLAVIA